MNSINQPPFSISNQPPFFRACLSRSSADSQTRHGRICRDEKTVYQVFRACSAEPGLKSGRLALQQEIGNVCYMKNHTRECSENLTSRNFSSPMPFKGERLSKDLNTTSQVFVSLLRFLRKVKERRKRDFC